MIVVSGCPRSGTSLMMNLLRIALGEDRILGSKITGEFGPGEKEENESEGVYQVRKYLWGLNKEEFQKEYERTRSMNPNGYWEMLYTVLGVYYRLEDVERLDKLIKEPKDKLSVAKIVSQGLYQSDPRYIDKIIYMIRHPRVVAKSQERLMRTIPLEDVVIHTPEMYIQVTGMASRWLVANPDIPIQYVFFDDLIEKPTKVLQEVKTFLDEGDFDKAAGEIEPALRRSYPEDVRSNLWEEAEIVYKLFINKEYAEIVKYLDNPKLWVYTDKRQFPCLRRGMPTTHLECQQCIDNEMVRKNFRSYATGEDIKWKNLPCLFECGMNIHKNDFLTIEESINNNSWLPGDTDENN